MLPSIKRQTKMGRHILNLGTKSIDHFLTSMTCIFRENPLWYSDGSRPLRFKKHAQRRHAPTYLRIHSDLVAGIIGIRTFWKRLMISKLF